MRGNLLVIVSRMSTVGHQKFQKLLTCWYYTRTHKSCIAFASAGADVMKTKEHTPVCEICTVIQHNLHRSRGTKSTKVSLGSCCE